MYVLMAEVYVYVDHSVNFGELFIGVFRTKEDAVWNKKV